MKPVKKIILTAAFCYLMFTACKIHKPIMIHGMQEFIALKLIDSNHYRYLHYNLGDTTFNYEYNTGHYIKDGHIYKLFPDSIQADDYQVEVIQKKDVSLHYKVKFHITTDITGDYLNQYIIQLSNDIVFHGVSADTVISTNTKEFKVKITLAKRYVNGMGNKLPTFLCFTTKNISLGEGENDISIHIPVRFSTFFYHYQKELDLRDDDKGYWNVNGRNIPMRDENF
jgi:hypothetical protein